jgi:DNA-binding CsgD family transcriptional regulator
LTDPRDADRRAWHLAAAASGIDNAAAAELERAAGRAFDRGGPAAATRALERAAELSGDRADRARRLVGAARAAYDAGQVDRAAHLAAAGLAVTTDPGEQAEAAWIQAQVAYERHSPAAACALSLDAAVPILSADPDRAAAVLTEATWCARDAADPELLRRCAEQLKSVQGGPPVMIDALTGLTDLLQGSPEAGVPPLRALLVAAQDGLVAEKVELLMAGFAGLLIGDDDDALTLIDDHVAGLRGQEALGLAQLATGRFQDARANVAEAIELATDLGLDLQVVVLTSISAWLAAVRGDVETVQKQSGLVLGDTRQHRVAWGFATWAGALIDLTAGDPAGALDKLEPLCDGPAGRDLTMRAIPDHVEAAVRVGDDDRARRHLPRLIEWATSAGTPVARGLVLRCEALVADGAEAFEAALRLDGCGPYDRARTQLAYGEWLRRNRRRTAARAQLVEAFDAFEWIGAHGWRQRARNELTALGETIPAPAVAVEGVGQLTPQELQVVRRAAQGMSNREIAAELFLSPRTIGHHLYKAYPKLGVSRRSQLARLIP